MGHNCVAHLPIGKDDARDPLMWYAAHLRALRGGACVLLDMNIAVQRAQLQT
jgi:hypothetical protein